VIERLYLRELLGFEVVDLSFHKGLVVLSGPSGAGKSVLMSSVLASFGMGSAEAKLCEVALYRPTKLQSDAYDLEEDLVIRSLKKDRIRYYLNEQNISKKSLQQLFAPYVHYLSVRDSGGFESAVLLEMLDHALISEDKYYQKMYKEYQNRYVNYHNKLVELTEIQEKESKLTELIEFTTYEINKIKSIDPKLGEDEMLLHLKKQLSRIDKINDALGGAEAIFGLEAQVSEVFRLINKEGGYFFDAMNQLRSDFEETQTLTEELEETDVEALLDRLEKITELKNRYGSIGEAIAYRESKEQELAGYARIEQDKSVLEDFLQIEYSELSTIAGRITQARVVQSEKFATEVSESLSRLKLPTVSFRFEMIDLGETGTDSVDLVLSGSATATLSGGEHNRLRLALMVASLGAREGEGGVIILDEIDANVSGDESIAIAELIATLSSVYQIFAISHQPHLAAKADQHILIDRQGDASRASLLDQAGRINEISRIIGGEASNAEAVAFAKKLLDQH
jgi:DNA repair protein RecN (Recombination protein N)